MNSIQKMKIIFFVGIITIAAFPAWYPPLIRAPETTGVCIYKGPAFYGFFVSSDGVPLRGINVTVFDYSNDYPYNVLTFGLTDRTGCFYFTAPYGWHSTLSYSYNGTMYTDNIQSGVVLGDHVP